MGQAAEVGVRPDMGEHKTPWGSYQVLDSGPGYKIKRLTVESGQALSLQIHTQRDERWMVAKGVATVTKGEQHLILHIGGTVFIPFGTIHRLTNNSDIRLELIEIQYGDYLGEDDIVRLEDRYGRKVG